MGVPPCRGWGRGGGTNTWGHLSLRPALVQRSQGPLGTFDWPCCFCVGSLGSWGGLLRAEQGGCGGGELPVVSASGTGLGPGDRRAGAVRERRGWCGRGGKGSRLLAGSPDYGWADSVPLGWRGAPGAGGSDARLPAPSMPPQAPSILS